MTPGTCHCPEELEWLCRDRPVQTCTDSLTPSGAVPSAGGAVGTGTGRGGSRKSSLLGVRTPKWPWTSRVTSLGLNLCHR